MFESEVGDGEVVDGVMDGEGRGEAGKRAMQRPTRTERRKPLELKFQRDAQGGHRQSKGQKVKPLRFFSR